jgi:hypothetical protein
MVRVGSARIDENGKVMGGQPGDQTGLEVAIEPWYPNPKKYVVARAKRASVRESIASDMEAACANDMIGYNQVRSWDLYDKSKPYGWDCSKVKVASDVDCSTLVRACVAYALQRDIPWFSTLNEIEKLSETGEFEILRDEKYSQSPDYLLRGDILCTATQGHTLVVLDNGAKAGQSGSQPPQNSTEGNTSLCGKGIGTAVALTPMNIRTGADTSAKILDTIKTSVAVEVLEITASGWYKIVWPGEACGYAFTKAGSSYYSYSANANAQVINLGDKVQFTGNKQYMSAWADKPITAIPEVATVTSICESGKHQYHIIGDNVYGWVNREDIVRK